MKINNLYCIDNIEGMRQVPDEFIDLTVTSPPYDNLRKYKGYKFEYEPVIEELFRITKTGGVVVWIVSDATIKGSETMTSFRQALWASLCGFNLHDTMIWNKPTIPLSHNRYEQSFEYMFVFSKGKPKTFNGIREEYSESTIKRLGSGDAYSYKNRNGLPDEEIKISKKRTLNPNGTLKKNVWNISPDIKLSKNEKYLIKHPARFPEELAKNHIISWSNEGDLVFDPFVGSGTTAKVAKLLGRNYLGFDISQEYIDIANRRLEY